MRICILIALFLGIVTSYAFAQQTYLGEMRVVGDGTIATFVTLNGVGQPETVGVTFTPTLLNSLPSGMEEYPLRFPPQAQGVPFTHFVLNWEPHGHIPTEIYGLPHFDFHFYLLTPAEREGITATGEDLARVEKAPPAQFVPQGYVATPGGEPRMGAHWIDPTSHEFHGTPFDETFIYGFYNGRLAFIEPMITQAFLHGRTTVDRPIAQPQAYQQPGYYPTRFRVTYDPARGLYTVALAGLTYRR